VKHVSENVYTNFVNSVQSAMELSIHHKLELQFEDRSKELREKIVQEMLIDSLEAQAHHAELHVIENIFNTCCPRCGQVFCDFDGCFALECSRCHAGICGWCLEDCGSNAHDHVISCKFNAYRHFQMFFAPFDMFEQARNRSRVEKLKVYMNSLESELRSLVGKKLRPHLEQMNFEIDTIVSIIG